MKALITLLFMISTLRCFADFVDVATIRVNNETIREITRNTQSPYLISFTNSKPGDTLSLSIWTDHGGEKNAYFSYVNLITGNGDTLEKSNRIILTESLINEPHLFSVTLVYQVRSNTFSSKWEMFETTQNTQIEDIYSSLNNFVSTLKDFNNSKNNVDSIKEFLSDSVTFNYISKYAKNTLGRELQPKLITVHKSKTPDFLKLSPLELDYFKKFNSKNYVQLYNLSSDFYGNITIADDLNTFEFYLRNFLGEELIFKFIRKNSSFLLKEVSYEKSTQEQSPLVAKSPRISINSETSFNGIHIFVVFHFGILQTACMSKLKKKPNQNNQKQKNTNKLGNAPELIREPGVFAFLPTFRQRLIALLAFTFLLFANTIMNESALDDEIVLDKNQYVQEGTSGIGDILTHDAYSSYYESMQAEDQLSGGRYRPLSIVTFAIEEAIFGFSDGDEVTFSENGVEYSGTIQRSIFDEKEVLVRQDDGTKTLKRVKVSNIDGYTTVYHGRHFVNVLLYLLTIGILFYLLHFIFLPQFRDIAFLALIIFAAHPIHTEVVANVKSRDEILSLLFIGLTFISAFKWRESKKTRMLLATCCFYFLALLSKEWGIVLIALLPIAFVVFRKETVSLALKSSIPLFLIAAIYMLIRVNVVGAGNVEKQLDILNDPYLYASAVEKFATKTAVLLKYFTLHVFPHPLSSDYSFKAIEYRNFGSWDFWASLLFHIGLIAVMIKLFIQKHVLAFALAFYLGPLFLVSNFVFDIGATMGERLVFHSSFGFCILIAYLLIKPIQKLGNVNRQKWLFLPFLAVLLGLASFKTIDRNGDWKNNTTLFIHDAQVVPQSVLANGNAGKAYLELAEKEKPGGNEQKELLKKAELHLNRALKIDSNYYGAHLNLGYVWYLRDNLENAESSWKTAETIFSRQNHPLFWKKYDQALAFAYYNRGLIAAQKKEIGESRKYMEKAVTYDPSNVQYLEDLGGACYTLGDQKAALEAWSTALSIDPTKMNCRAGYRAITGKEWGQQ